ncbi:hypothetical protein DSCA_55420 [Desulfosarcina alkanivorans]|uniref:Uncharacterized protein n=1 Tax=Desulfosarcina alkanivorans TaxID=571177 RepID=A0A5K7YP98_9BACT|nr:hypothetical protein DSCA_55420 [Desulfosarcina alkanivorans]
MLLSLLANYTPLVDFTPETQTNIEPSFFADTNIVSIFQEKARANLFTRASYCLKTAETDVRLNLFEGFICEI